ncbi:MAG: AAA family ATPase [Acidobacteriia bacterium]|nr:AAA family ATPase [Terriglobia bacterium]
MNDYKDDFDPSDYRLGGADAGTKRGLDVRDGSVYVYEDEIKLAVRVALATGRPLLLLGAPGSGKSSLAAFVARTMNWNYFEQVVTSRTKAQDLLWTFDAVRRLRDAQANELQDQIESYRVRLFCVLG